MNRRARSIPPRTRAAHPSVVTAGPAGERHRAGAQLPWSLLLILLFGTLTAGRSTMSRWGIPEADDFEIRIPLLGLLLTWFLLWITATRRDVAERWPTTMKLVVLHFGVLLLAGLWAEPQAQIWSSAFDLLVLLTLVCVAMTAANRDPRRAALQFAVMLYATGIFFALIGLAMGNFNAQGRLAALGGGPNVFVRVVLLGLLAAIVLAVHRKRLLYLAAAPLLAYAAVLSGSRGGLISALLTGQLALLYYGRRFKPRYVISGVLLALGTLYLLTGAGAEGRLGWIYRRYSLELLINNQYSNRPELIQQAMDIFAEHPVAGAGIDSFAATYAPGQSDMYAHNYVASIAADTGAIGLCVLAVALLAVLVSALRRLRTATAAQAGLLFGTLFILIAANFSGDYYDSRTGWVCLAVALAGPHGGRADSDPDERRRRVWPRPRSRPGLALAGRANQ